jgi:hypothetical protein
MYESEWNINEDQPTMVLYYASVSSPGASLSYVISKSHDLSASSLTKDGFFSTYLLYPVILPVTGV